MGEVVSLSKHRKAKERASRQRQAEANRAKFGRTKAAKSEDESEARRAEKAHALLKFEPPPAGAAEPEAPSDETGS
jgi:hypothetical protein